jgi:hypothetical protein
VLTTALNLSEFVDDCSGSVRSRLCRSKTRRFPCQGLENEATSPGVSASIDELQTASN